MSTLLFIIGLLLGGSIGFIVAALVNIVDRGDDDAEL